MTVVSVTVVLCVVMLAAAFGCYAWYQRRKFEAQLQAASWKVDYEDLKFIKFDQVKYALFKLMYYLQSTTVFNMVKYRRPKYITRTINKADGVYDIINAQ